MDAFYWGSNMKYLLAVVITLFSITALAETQQANLNVSDNFFVLSLLVLGAASLIYARRKSAQ